MGAEPSPPLPTVLPLADLFEELRVSSCHAQSDQWPLSDQPLLCRSATVNISHTKQEFTADMFRPAQVPCGPNLVLKICLIVWTNPNYPNSLCQSGMQMVQLNTFVDRPEVCRKWVAVAGWERASADHRIPSSYEPLSSCFCRKKIGAKWKFPVGKWDWNASFFFFVFSVHQRTKNVIWAFQQHCELCHSISDTLRKCYVSATLGSDFAVLYSMSLRLSANTNLWVQMLFSQFLFWNEGGLGVYRRRK